MAPIRAMSEAWFEIDPEVEVWRLPKGMRQRVEILKAPYRGVDILVLTIHERAPSDIATFLKVCGRPCWPPVRLSCSSRTSWRR